MRLPKLDIHKPSTQAALGGAGLVVAYALYKRHHAAGAGGTSSGSSLGTSSQLSSTDPLASAALDEASIEGNIVGDLQPQLDSLSQQISNLPPPAKTPTPLPTPTNPQKILPKLNNNDFLQQIDQARFGDLVALGSFTAPGQYSGKGVTGGAPVYYLFPGQSVAVQGGPGVNSPVGTKEFTLKSLS